MTVYRTARPARTRDVGVYRRRTRSGSSIRTGSARPASPRRSCRRCRWRSSRRRPEPYGRAPWPRRRSPSPFWLRNDGSAIAARMPMIRITTSSSMSVNPASPGRASVRVCALGGHRQHPSELATSLRIASAAIGTCHPRSARRLPRASAPRRSCSDADAPRRAWDAARSLVPLPPPTAASSARRGTGLGSRRSHTGHESALADRPRLDHRPYQRRRRAFGHRPTARRYG